MSLLISALIPFVVVILVLHPVNLLPIDGRAGGITYYDADQGAPQAAPTLIGATAQAQKWEAEQAYLTTYMARRSGLTQPERGEAPSGVTAAQALQLLREESAEHRRPRIDAIAEALQRLFAHGLQLMQHYVVEPRIAWDRNDSGAEFQVFWQGTDFQGQTDVVIETEGAADSEALRNAKLKDAVDWGLINMQDPRQRRILGRLQGAPTELFQLEDLQTAAAEREYGRLTGSVDIEAGVVEMGQAPVVDPSLDDHAVHADRHGRDFLSDEWRALEEMAGWDEILSVLSAWDQIYVATGADQGAFGLNAGINAVQDGILGLWQSMLANAGRTDLILIDDNGIQYGNPAIEIVLVGRAHREAHVWLAQAAAVAAAGGAPVAPAPGKGAAAETAPA